MRLFLPSFALLTTALSAAAQTPPEPTPTPPRRPGWFGGGRSEMHRPEGRGPDAEKFEHVRKTLETLTPEQRKRFHENFLRWSNLPPEEKKALANRETFRRQRMTEEVNAALKDAGMELDTERRELFARRYGEERHKLEEQLRKEMEDKRRPLLQEIIAKLKAEFSAAAPASGTGAKVPAKPPEASSQP